MVEQPTSIESSITLRNKVLAGFSFTFFRFLAVVALLRRAPQSHRLSTAQQRRSARSRPVDGNARASEPREHCNSVVLLSLNFLSFTV